MPWFSFLPSRYCLNFISFFFLLILCTQPGQKPYCGRFSWPSDKHSASKYSWYPTASLESYLKALQTHVVAWQYMVYIQVQCVCADLNGFWLQPANHVLQMNIEKTIGFTRLQLLGIFRDWVASQIRVLLLRPLPIAHTHIHLHTINTCTRLMNCSRINLTLSI